MRLVEVRLWLGELVPCQRIEDWNRTEEKNDGNHLGGVLRGMLEHSRLLGYLCLVTYSMTME